MAWGALVHSIAILCGLLPLIGMVITPFRAVPSPLRLSFEMDKSIKVEIESISIPTDGLGSHSSPSHCSSARSSPEPAMVLGDEHVAVASRGCRPASEPIVDRRRFMATAPLRATSSDSSTPRLRPRRVLKQALPRAALR
ncbi:hypothetical protein BV22DRAFT_1199356 [Leucogyrophana mollusca]|uniref:Uncharacterized protein n=1 Tax=Leucogyrophana mollusca TaxID=85980 RepID=A0ACB8B1K2_9AGAM|nr:hypothetical protein BV22DRAFT_1199356 [Leucogyrophana mollusca]